MNSINSESKSNEDWYLVSKLESIITVPLLLKVFVFGSSFILLSISFWLLFQGKRFWILLRNPELEFDDVLAESVIGSSSKETFS